MMRMHWLLSWAAVLSSARVAKVAAPGEGCRALPHAELRLLALQVSPISGIGLEQIPPRLHIVVLYQRGS